MLKIPPNVKKIPSMNILEIAEAIAPKLKHKIVGIRPGEKIHEQMIGWEDAPFTYEYDDYYKILPAIHGWNEDLKRTAGGKQVGKNFIYSSDNNKEWMKKTELTNWVEKNIDELGKI